MVNFLSELLNRILSKRNEYNQSANGKTNQKRRKFKGNLSNIVTSVLQLKPQSICPNIAIATINGNKASPIIHIVRKYLEIFFTLSTAAIADKELSIRE